MPRKGAHEHLFFGCGGLRVERECGFFEQFGGDEVFKSAAHAFEERDVLRAVSNRFLSQRQLMQIGEKALALDHPSFQRNEKISCFGERAVVGVDHDAGVAHGDIVELARSGLEAADRVDMRSLAKHVAVEERCLGGGAGAEDVGLVGAGARVDGFDFHVKLVLHVVGEEAGASGVFAADQSAFEVADLTQDLQVGASLASGAEDAENAGIFASEQAGGDGGGGGGAHVGEIVGGDDEFGAAGLGVNKDVGGLEAVVGHAGMLVELNEFHAEAAADAIVAGHDEEDAVGKLHLRTRRHEGGRVAGAECFFDRGNERARVEEAMNFHFGQDVHGWVPLEHIKGSGQFSVPSSQLSEQTFMELLAWEAACEKHLTARFAKRALSSPKKGRFIQRRKNPQAGACVCHRSIGLILFARC
jgi:hypothetical protein